MDQWMEMQKMTNICYNILHKSYFLHINLSVKCIRYNETLISFHHSFLCSMLEVETYPDHYIKKFERVCLKTLRLQISFLDGPWPNPIFRRSSYPIALWKSKHVCGLLTMFLKSPEVLGTLETFPINTKRRVWGRLSEIEHKWNIIWARGCKMSCSTQLALFVLHQSA